MASPTLSQRIAARQTAPRRTSRAAFIALRDEIAQARADGWPLVAIWDTLRAEGKVTFGYDAFRRLARQTLSAANAAPARVPRAPRSAEAPPRAQPNGFSFNPKANPEKLF